jgi:hypothetical protein
MRRRSDGEKIDARSDSKKCDKMHERSAVSSDVTGCIDFEREQQVA